MKRQLSYVFGTLAIVTVIAACGDSDDTSTATTLAPAATSGPTTEAPASTIAPSVTDPAFPVTVSNALGDVVVPAAPQRVVAIGDAELDVLLAMGIVPTAWVTYADDLLPYQTAELGAATPPELFSLVDGVPIEQIAAQRPDLIVSLSWTDEDNYPLLNGIAPVVAYVDAPWGDSWQTQVAQIAAGLGRPDDGAALIADIESQISETAAAHPELSGATVTFTSASADSMCSVDLPTSPVLVFLRELGLEPTLDDPASTYCLEVSFEQLDRIDADVMLLFGDREAVEANSLFEQLPGVVDGSAVWLDDVMAQAVNSPTPLAIPAFLAAIVPQMVAVAG